MLVFRTTSTYTSTCTTINTSDVNMIVLLVQAQAEAQTQDKKKKMVGLWRQGIGALRRYGMHNTTKSTGTTPLNDTSHGRRTSTVWGSVYVNIGKCVTTWQEGH